MPIGTLGEKSLHAGLKAWYAQPGDRLEEKVDGYVVDIVRGDALIEIQTRNFSALKLKLARLLEHHPVRLVYPLPREKWIIRQDAEGKSLSHRRSPRPGRIENLFRELVYIAHLLPHPNLTFVVAFTRQEQILRDDGKGSWRRKHWSVHDCHLLEVVGEKIFHFPADFIAFLPQDLPQPFTNRDLSRALRCTYSLAAKITFTLSKAGVLADAGKRRRARLYQLLIRIN